MPIRYTWLDVVVELPEQYEAAFWQRVKDKNLSLQEAMVATLTDFYNESPEDYKKLYGKFNPQAEIL